MVMLNHQLPALPPVHAFWGELPTLFAWLAEGRQPIALAAYVMAAGDVVIRPPAGAISIPGMASSAPIEVIRFAASNRLCVELDYVDERGNRGVRLIEPYSMRRTQAGDVILHALLADGTGHRSYGVNRIKGSRATNQTFTGPFAIIPLNLTSGVSLMNPASVFHGQGSVAPPVTSLGPGQTTTLTVSFYNPSVASIKFVPQAFLASN